MHATYNSHLVSCHAALYVFLIAYGAAIFFSFGTHQLDLGWVYDNFVPLITGAVIFSTALSLYLYASSFGKVRRPRCYASLPSMHVQIAWR